MEQRKLIIFDGISGSGKSTLEDAFRKANNYYDYTIHRFTASKWVYSTLYERPISYHQLEEDEYAIQRIFPTFYFLLVCDVEVCYERKMALGDTNVEPNMSIAQKAFIDNYHNYSKLKNRMILSTESKTVEECVNIVISRLAL